MDHSKIAYFFDYLAAPTASDGAVKHLKNAVVEWQERWRSAQPSLVYQRRPGSLGLIDRRTDQARYAELTGWQAEAYEACGDDPRSANAVHRQLVEAGHDATREQIAALLAACCRSKVMVTEDGKYLSLALPQNSGW